MKSKSLLTFVLLGFVAASVAVTVWKAVRPRSVSPRPTADGARGAKLVAYYFHGKVRCVTCNDIEASAREAIQAGFGPELDAGRLEWRTINYEEPGNEHYASDYQLPAPCVVLASMRDGHQESWTSLPEVWELIGDPPAFRRFVQQRVAEQLATQAMPAREPQSEATSAAGLTESLVSPTKRKSPALPKLLDLGAGRCIPCKQMAPILKELRQTYQGRFDVVFVDVWEDPTAADSYGVSTIPTQIFFDAEGEERFRHEGFLSKEEILATWRRLGIDIRDRSGSE